MQKIFSSEKLTENTWIIQGHGSAVYLCAGENEAVVIDSGDAYENIRKYAESLCGRPCYCVLNTHGHFDHTGGNGYFKAAFMGKLAGEIAKIPNGNQPLNKYNTDYPIVIVEDGFKYDLGDRYLEAIVMTGHSPDSVVWLDKKARILFTGDNICPFVPLMYKCESPQPSIIQYVQSLGKVMEYRSEFDFIGYGHGEKLLSAECFDNVVVAAIKALHGEYEKMPPKKRIVDENERDKGPDFSKHNMDNHCFSQYKDAKIFFDKRFIDDKQKYRNVKNT